MSQNKSKKILRKQKKGSTRWAPLLFVVGGVLLTIFAIWGLRDKSNAKATIEVTGMPSLKVDKESVDLGNVKLDKHAEVSFELTNVGDQTLRFAEEPYIEVVQGC